VLLSSKSCLFYLPEASWRLETTDVANFVGKRERVREGVRERSWRKGRKTKPRLWTSETTDRIV